MGNAAFNVTAEAIIECIKILGDVFGRRWLSKRVINIQTAIPSEIPRKHTYLYKPPNHPLIDLYNGLILWLKHFQTNRGEPNESVMLLLVLANHIKSMKGQPHFERIVSRMKNSEQFFAACFELEVASYHVAGGSTVEFLEEKENKTPDLKVTLKNGTSFLVECKAIDIKSDRDLKYESMWKRVEQTILEYMNQRKLNYLILVRALCDPNPADVDYLIDLIIKGLNQGGMGELWGDQSGIAIGPDPTGRYLIYVKFLSAPDEQMREGSLELYFQDEPSRWTCVKEAMFNEKGEHFFRNLKAFHFSTALPSDRMPSVLNALNAATKQLPSEGPGVVWIKVPETWIYGEDNNFLKVENLLRKKMTGDHNRRINRVVLITSKMERFSENGVPKLIFRPIFSEIDHNNPRSKLDWGS